MVIVDMFGNKIQVTDFTQALEQSRMCANSPFKMKPFKLESGFAYEASGPETTVGVYNADLLVKLQNMPISEIVSHV
ncbi:hypothetical protein [Photobacterium leiognathi]|uniref:hypothetical protein n=1 Tax=Photobacterium leiognathi TaxID=553611 RepID=UPI002980B700|nr:hypothetical protein [Photobacterium leiognathi]